MLLKKHVFTQWQIINKTLKIIIKKAFHDERLFYLIKLNSIDLIYYLFLQLTHS